MVYLVQNEESLSRLPGGRGIRMNGAGGRTAATGSVPAGTTIIGEDLLLTSRVRLRSWPGSIRGMTRM